MEVYTVSFVKVNARKFKDTNIEIIGVYADLNDAIKAKKTAFDSRIANFKSDKNRKMNILSAVDLDVSTEVKLGVGNGGLEFVDEIWKFSIDKMEVM